MQPAHLFHKILVGVDEQGLATQAVVRAAALAKQLGSRLTLVQAVEVPPPLWLGIDEQELADMHASTLARARQATLQSLASALREARVELDLEHSLCIYPGHPAKVLLKHAAELPADLILLGPHARHSVLDFGHTGRTDRALLSHTRCPLWIQPEAATPIRSILVGTDFSEHSREALDLAHALAARLGASIHVLHGHAPQPALAHGFLAGPMPLPATLHAQEIEAAQTQLDELMDGYPWGAVEASSTLVENIPTQALLAAAAEHDLTVLGTHGRTGLSRFLTGSVAHGVVSSAATPTLVVPSSGRAWLLEG